MSRRWIRAAFWLLAALSCLLGAARLGKELPGAYVALYWRSKTIEPETLDRALHNADTPTQAVLWEMKHGQEAEGLFASEVSVARYCGDMRLLAGGALRSGDPGGCALSEEAAHALFGNANATGRTLTIEGRSYTVRAVFAHGQADVLIEWDGAGELRCSRMALAFPEYPRGLWGQKALAFTQNASLPDADAAFDGALVYAMARMEAPRWMVPTRWSDFAAWRRVLDEAIGRVRTTLRAEHAPVDAALLECAIALFLAEIAFACCLIRVALCLWRLKRYYAACPR